MLRNFVDGEKKLFWDLEDKITDAYNFPVYK